MEERHTVFEDLVYQIHLIICSYHTNPRTVLLPIFFEDITGRPIEIRRRMSWIHHLLSPYQLRGFRTSYRDDNFGAITTLAILLNRTSWGNHCLTVKEARLMEIENGNFMFAMPRRKDPILNEIKSEALYREIRSKLWRILSIVRNLPDIHLLPDYDRLITLFDQPISLVRTYFQL